MEPRPDYAKTMTEFHIDKYFDAIKLVGTGNSAGLFGAAVAIYYFKDRVPNIIHHIKTAAFAYLAGIFLFALSYAAFIAFVHRHQSKIELGTFRDQFRADPVFDFSMYVGIVSITAWIMGTIEAAYVIYLL